MEEIVIFTNIKIIKILMLIMILMIITIVILILMIMIIKITTSKYIYMPYSQFQRNFDSVKIPVSLTNFSHFYFCLLCFVLVM